MLTRCQTRQKLKEAYAAEFAATIERAEKQIILARHGRRLLNLLDDTPVVPGNVRPVYEHANQARQILNDAEDDLREWQPELEEIGSSAQGLGNNLMPAESMAGGLEQDIASGREFGGTAAEGSHLSQQHDTASRITSSSVATGPTYAESEAV